MTWDVRDGFYLIETKFVNFKWIQEAVQEHWAKILEVEFGKLFATLTETEETFVLDEHHKVKLRCANMYDNDVNCMNL